MNFQEFEELINSGIKEIVLDSDLKINPPQNILEYRCGINNDDVVIDGNGHSIDGLNRYGIFRISGENVTLKNIVFKNSWGTAIINCGSLNIENCIFRDNTEDRCKIDSRHDGYLHSFAGSSGAIYGRDDSKINIKSCLFEKNKGYLGVIYYTQGTLNIENSLFKDNRGIHIFCEGEELNLDSCEFKGKYEEILKTHDSKVNISNSKFENHHLIIENREYDLLNDIQIEKFLTFKDLKEFMDSDENEIIFDKDIYLNKSIYIQANYSQSTYYKPNDSGLLIYKNNLIIDGKGNKIYGYGTSRIFTIHSDKLILRNINFEDAKIECCKGSVTLENCCFKGEKE